MWDGYFQWFYGITGFCGAAGSGISTNGGKTVMMFLLMSKAGTDYCYAGMDVHRLEITCHRCEKRESGSTQSPGLNTGFLLHKDTGVMTY